MMGLESKALIFDTTDVLFEARANIGLITLNRPNALNALSFAMFKAIRAQLLAWKNDTNIHAVVIQSVPGRAFCAGGDVRWVYEIGRKNLEHAMDLFWEEYQLDGLTASLGKPYVALMDGLNIGGGVGITLHGSHRVASEHFAFTMPEASIGLYPDIGSSHLLANCPFGYGIYLGLTGRRINGQDSKTLKLVDYTISSNKFDEIKAQLFEKDLSSDAFEQVTNLLLQYQTEMPEGNFSQEAALVSACFEHAKSLDEIISALKAKDNEWASEVIKTLKEQSPTSLHVTLEQLRRARGLSLRACLEMDYGLTYQFLQGHDFYEGVRARLVDKDKNPRWKPNTIEALSKADVAQYFMPPKDIKALW